MAIGVVCAAGVLAASAGTVSAAAFTPNNLAISSVTSTAAFNGQAGAVTIREFGLTGATSGAFNGNNIALGSTAGDPTRLTIGASTSAEGALTLSQNGQYLTMAGYNWVAGVASPNGTTIGASFNNGTGNPDVRRVVGRLDGSGAVNYYEMTQAYSNSNFRSVITQDGNTFITGGVAGTTNNQTITGGVRSFDPSLGTTSTQLIANATNIRNVNYNPSGQILFSTQSGSFIGINVVDGGAGYLLPGFAAVTGLSTYDFWQADGSTIYAADDGSIGSASTNRGGLQKWVLNSTTGNWELAYRITGGLTAGLRGLAGTVDASGNVILYATTADAINATTGNKLVAVVDTGAASVFTTLATAAGNTAFRGVDFTPGSPVIPAPGAAALLAMGGLIAGRRRR